MSSYRAASYIAAASVLSGRPVGATQVAELAGELYHQMIADDVEAEDAANTSEWKS